MEKSIFVEPVLDEPETVIEQGDNPVEEEDLVERKKVVKRSTTKWKLWPIILTAVMINLSMLGIKVPQSIVTDVINETSRLEFEVGDFHEEDIYETVEDVTKRVQSKFQVGKGVEVEEGIKFHESSDFDLGGSSLEGTFGQGLREASTYNMDMVSVIYNGKIVNVVKEENANLQNIIENTAKNLNVKETDLTVRVHLGGPTAGWVDINDLMKMSDLTPQIIAQKSVLDSEYKGVQNNFTGDITFFTEEGIVTARVIDENGNLLSKGSKVIGSDGKEYVLTSISLEQVQQVTTNIVNTPRKVTFGIQNLTMLEAFSCGALGVLMSLIAKESKTKEQSVTEEEYEKMLKQAKEKFDSKSRFVRLINKLNSKKVNWAKINFKYQKGNLEVDKISELYEPENGFPKL